MTQPTDDKHADDLTEGALNALRVLGQARAWAFFAVGDCGARLLASDKIDSGCTDDVVPLLDTRAGPTLDASAHAPSRARLLVVFPRSVPSHSHGLLYLEDPPQRTRLGLFLSLHTRELDALLRATSGTTISILSRVPSDPVEAEAEALRLLLARHEWNVARVARDLRVTRSTVYSRMRRHGIPRVKIPKAPRHPRRGRDGA